MSNQPISGVVVQIGSISTTTDSKGYFKLSNLTLNVKSAVLHVQKAGYYNSLKTFNATKGNNYIKIKMLPKNITSTFSSINDEVIVLPNNSSISITANSLVSKSTGQVYIGTVNTYAFFIDPAMPGFEEQIPGSLAAKNNSGETVSLTSFGMLAIELESPTGDKLQLASNKTASLNFTIPASLINDAPATIPLWYMNEVNGLWEQQGTATKIAGKYVGEVSHFSFWNCDVPFPSVTISMSLFDSQYNPFQYIKVKIKRNVATNQSSSYGYTDSLGIVSGLVPINEILVMEIVNSCEEVLFEKNIGPFSADTDLGSIIVQNILSDKIIKILGNVVSCNNATVTEGYANLQYDNNQYYVPINSSGQFVFSIVKCNNPGIALLNATDVTNSQQGQPIQITLLSPITNIGTIPACGISTVQFFNYYIDNTLYTISSTDPTHQFTGLKTTSGSPMEAHSIAGKKQFSPNDIIIQFKDNYQSIGAGQYVFLYLKEYGYPTIISPSEIIITNLPTIGGYYEGSFNTNFKDATNATHNLRGTFKVKRNS